MRLDDAIGQRLVQCACASAGQVRANGVAHVLYVRSSLRQIIALGFGCGWFMAACSFVCCVCMCVCACVIAGRRMRGKGAPRLTIRLFIGSILAQIMCQTPKKCPPLRAMTTLATSTSSAHSAYSVFLFRVVQRPGCGFNTH